MKTLTPKQRARIYRAAAEYFSTASWWDVSTRGFCSYLTKNHESVYLSDLPEIESFSYKTDLIGYWLDTTNRFGAIIHNHNQRIMCLLLAEQMALNPRFKL